MPVNGGAERFSGYLSLHIAGDDGGQSSITLVPEMALHAELMPQESITFLPFEDPDPHRQISLVWRPTLPRKQDMELLAESMERQLKLFWPESVNQH